MSDSEVGAATRAPRGALLPQHLPRPELWHPYNTRLGPGEWRDGVWIMVDDDRMPPQPGEKRQGYF